MTDAGNAMRRLARAVEALRASEPLVRLGGSVALAAPTHVEVAGLSRHVQLGDCVEARTAGRTLLAQVVRLEPERVVIEFFDDDVKLPLGAPVMRSGPLSLAAGPEWRGRIVDSLGRPLDGRGPLPRSVPARAVEATPPAALQRQRTGGAIVTGVRVIDLFTPLCGGQRIGIFAGSGVGKSTLLGMLAQSRGFDSCVVALVGERGREVREFVEDVLAAALSRSVVVVATGDESAMMRRQAPRAAMSIAEALRDSGDKVLLIVDSLTRYAHALREVALAGGEPPVARGYTPSVLSDLPRLLERAGPGAAGTGSITGIFAVLVDGDDHNDPISDAVRGILDGHIVLDRAVAARGQYPAVDVLGSISRLADRVWSEEQRALVRRLRSWIAAYEETRDLRSMGAHKAGSNAELDKAVRVVPQLYELLAQRHGDTCEDVFQLVAAQLAA